MKQVKLIRGKWMFISDPTQWAGEVHRFVVHYIDERGNFKKAYAKSPLSHDINEAIVKGGVA